MNISRTIYSSEHTEYDVVYTPDIVFAKRETGDLTLQLITPVQPDLPMKRPEKPNPIMMKFARWRKEQNMELGGPKPEEKEQKLFPLIVDCPGSGWGGADGHRHVPYMVSLARKGFAAASVSYRGTYKDDVVFPAAVQDLKEAVRFLRKNAAMYHIDPDRIGIMGDSSGGNTAAMAALTSDGDSEFNIGENLDVSSAVAACCTVYGPVDLINLVQDRLDERKTLRPEEEPFPQGVPFEAMEIWQETYKDDPEKHLRLASPYYRIEEGKKLPPFLFIQGDDDAIIPMAQGLRFCDRLRECGGRAEFMKVVGAGHGNGIWSEEMLDTVAHFFKTYLG